MRSLFVAAALTSTMAAASDRAADARAFVAALDEGRFELLQSAFGPNLKKAMSAAQLRAAWSQLSSTAGTLQRVKGVEVHEEGGFTVALAHAQFARGPLDIKVVYQPDGLVEGLWFLPTVEAPPLKPLPKGVREVPVVVGDKTPYALPGALMLPTAAAGRLPVVVLVHGSGPNDRDETVRACRPFRDLAIGLAQRGVATLRYDKRTKVHAAKMTAGAKSFTVADETVDDALLAVALARTRRELDPKRVVVLGHSLGGYLAPRIAAQEPILAGLVLLAAPTRPLPQLVIEQLQTLGADAEKVREVKQAAARISALTDDSTEEVLDAPAAYWRDLRDYEPVSAAKKLSLPMLVMQGGRDYQVSSTKDFAGWRALEHPPAVTLRLYPMLNHLFIAGTGPSRPEEYAVEGHVDTAVIDDIAAWVKSR